MSCLGMQHLFKRFNDLRRESISTPSMDRWTCDPYAAQPVKQILMLSSGLQCLTVERCLLLQNTYARYPYSSASGKTGTCNTGLLNFPVGGGAQVSGSAKRVTPKSKAALLAAIAMAPATVGFDVQQSFMNYAGGVSMYQCDNVAGIILSGNTPIIHPFHYCNFCSLPGFETDYSHMLHVINLNTQVYTAGGGSGCGNQMNHAMNIVGYSTSGSTPYWIIRNSCEFSECECSGLTPL